mmetsp:Transcript_8743/g.11015  ORF Transcript_8743/g.11015 Transcript_8743/m.11015 type:complete len:94 (+) Transcript_8743:16-297(+)
MWRAELVLLIVVLHTGTVVLYENNRSEEYPERDPSFSILTFHSSIFNLITCSSKIPSPLASITKESMNNHAYNLMVLTTACNLSPKTKCSIYN